MRRAEVAAQPHPVRDALDQPTRTTVARVPLVAVHQLVGQDAGDLGGEAGGLDAVDVGEREVDLLVVVVEIGLEVGGSGG